MKRVGLVLTLSIIFLAFGSVAWATPIDSHYTVSATVISLGGNNYQYSYEITNVDQGTGAGNGLGGFFIQVPLSATVSNITDPPPYLDIANAHWVDFFSTSLDPANNFIGTLKPGYQWLGWWGGGTPAIYPIGTTASGFSFQVNAPPGVSQGEVTTYLWDRVNPPSYQSFEGNMTSPVPLPSAVLLLGSGLVGLAGLGWRRRKS